MTTLEKRTDVVQCPLRSFTQDGPERRVDTKTWDLTSPVQNHLPTGRQGDNLLVNDTS